MLPTNRHSFLFPRAVAVVLTVLMLLQFTPPTLAEEQRADEGPVFFPPPPNVPRLQFLQRYSSALDLSTKSKGFRDFVFGGEEREAKLVEKPYGVDVYDGAIFIVDTRGNGYGVFDIARSRSRMVQPTGRGELIKPINITIDEDGTRYITDTEREQILVFDAEDRFIRAIGSPGQFKPVDVAIVDDRVYVTDIMHHRVVALDKRTDDVVLEFGEAGSEPGELFHPTNLAIGSDGTIYVTDTSNFRVQQFNTDGELIRVIGSIGTSYGQFARPKGVTLDRDDNIYVVDAAFQNVQVLAPDETPLMAFGGPGPNNWDFALPTVVKIDYDNVEHFEKYAAQGFDIEYLVLVANQFGPNKVIVFGFGTLSE